VLLSLDGTLVVQVINFAIFFALVNVLFIRPVRVAIEKRRAYINSVLSDEEQFLAQCRAIEGQAESKRAAARREADVRLSKARTEAAAEADGILAQHADQAAMLVEKAQQTVAGEIAAVREREQKLVAELADLMVGKALAGERS